MPDRNSSLKTISVILLVVCGFVFIGCDGQGKSFSEERKKAKARETFVPPVYQRDTTAEYSRLIGGSFMPVRGYGLVIGLGKDGTTQVPPQLEQYMIKQLSIQGMGSARFGLSHLPPERILRDLDTAIVEISGFLPPAAPKGKVFDLNIRAIGGDVTSLDGGYLMPCDMRMAIQTQDPEYGSKILAQARGYVFVNPFIDETKPAEQAKLREGKIIGGGAVIEDRTVRLQLFSSDYARSRLIEKAINTRFQRPGGKKIANAVNSSTIDLTIPPRWHDEYEHFLDLVMHLPLRTSNGAWEAHAREIGEAMELPAAGHHDLALVWEAMGKRVLGLVGTYYTNTNPYVSFYSARTGLRLGDMVSAPEVVMRIAQSASHPLQIEAIEELGRTRTLLKAVHMLQNLLDDSNEFVRVAAYQALRDRGFSSMVDSIDIADGAFTVDVVKTKGKYAIYATQTDYSRIVLFGKDMEVGRPMFFTLPDSLLTINAANSEDNLNIYRKIKHSGRISPPTEIKPYVRTLIEFLGQRAAVDQKDTVTGLGLTYGQVVSTLYRLCRENAIPARFVLQKSTKLQDFLKDAGETGRPN